MTTPESTVEAKHGLPIDVGEFAAAIRVALYRADPHMPSYPVGIVEPILRALIARARNGSNNDG